MNYTQIGFMLSIFLLFLSCNKKQDKKDLNRLDKVEVKEKNNVDNPIKNLNYEYDIDYTQLNKSIKNKIKKLDKQYPSTPFYCVLEGNQYFITSSNKLKNIEENLFSSGFKYGIVNDSLKILLKQEYDKIYNPNLVILNCFEIKNNNKIGLFNYETTKILKPQFDFIIPSSNPVTNIAYGYKNNTWFEIINTDFTIRKIDFNPINVLEEIDFDITKINKNMMFNSYNVEEMDGLSSGFGIGFAPSYAEYLNLLPNNFYTEIVTGDYDAGTYKSNFKVSKKISLTDNIKAFIVDAFEAGSDARGYELEKSKVVIYNNTNKKLDTLSSNFKYSGSHFCDIPNTFKMINDSIFEIKYTSNTLLYDEQPTYNYIKLTNNNFNKLKSNRIFNFTKHIIINDDYFKGCYVKSMSSKEVEELEYAGNVWVTENLSINDLDIMRNEIYADYGYIFKSDKWKKYFSTKIWYKPKFDNVDDLISKKDSLNIIKILEFKNEMKNNEDEFIKKHIEAVGMAG